MTTQHNYDEADLQRQWEELETESNRPAQPTPDLNRRRRGIKKPLLISLAIIAIIGTLAFRALSGGEPEPPPLVFDIPEQTTESQDTISEYVAENRNALNDNVAHINSVGEDLAATQVQLNELIVSLQNLNPLQMQRNQEEIIEKVRELDSRQREIEEQVRKSFQFQADTRDLNGRVSELVQNHNTMAHDTAILKESLHQARLDIEYLTQQIAPPQETEPAITETSNDAALIRALAECRDASQIKPPATQGETISFVDHFISIYTEKMENGETTAFHLREELESCRNPTDS